MIAYDRAAQQITIVFRDHTCHRYSGVPEQVSPRVVVGASQSTYFNLEIRNHIPYQVITSFFLS